MIKKILSLCLVLAMAFGVTACGESKQTSNGNSSTTTQKTRKFTEAKGMIKYLTIDGKKIPFPETVGEYVSYLEKVGDKIELGNTGKTVDEADKLNAGGVSSMMAFLKVYLDDDNWQWFGVRYENDTKNSLPVSDCKVTQITLDYDTINEEENHHSIDSITFVDRNNNEILMDGKYTSTNLMKQIGGPEQNTDGHWYYSDDQGYKYELVTENKKGILTRVVITYPTKQK